MNRIKGLLFVFLFLFICGCTDREPTFPFANLTTSSFDSLRNKSYAINRRAVVRYIDSLRLSTRDTAFVDLYVNRYYASRKPFIWIDMRGADSRVDTLSSVLAGVEREGVRAKTVFAPQIADALCRLRALDFPAGHDVNLTLATLEYYSTKALSRYTAGMRFGFINPRKFMNSLEKENPDDSLCRNFRTLFALPSPTCSTAFLDSLIAAAADGTFAATMRSAVCKSDIYAHLREEFTKKDLPLARRRTLMVNMERLRWETGRSAKKYVWVNLPEFMLRAADEATGEALQMRVCAGSVKHKTPLLEGSLKRLELNPEWTVPLSIIRREIAVRHAEDEEYFERNNMRIVSKATGEEMAPADVSAEMLKSGQYRVVQSKGEGNSLGRMIFRFDNDYAIYLHDTNNRAAFTRSVRAVSHGCIRVEKPLELAIFLLDDKNEEDIDKIRIAIDLPPLTDEGRALAARENYKPIGLRTFKPEVPVFITYYTAYPAKDGSIVYTPDPYAYDGKIFKLLNEY